MDSSDRTPPVVVVGGGPAGMMAAGRAAACGAAVVLLEKNKRLGRKLLISGGGRCNVTTGIVDRHLLVARYGARAAGLHSPFSRFDPATMRTFLRERGLETKMEAEQRVFPVTDQAASVRAVFERYLEEGQVRVRTRSEVDAIQADHGRATGIRLRSGETIRCAALVLATGGVSRPETGSTGDGFRWLAETGHTVRVPKPSLVPIAVRERWPADVQGLALAHVKLTAVLDGAPQFSETGKLLFTHFGLSGPLVLNLSQRIGELAQGGPVELRIDLAPSTDGGALERDLQRVFDAAARRKIRNALGSLLPPRLVATVLGLAQVDGELECHSVTRAARKAVATRIKGVSVTFDSLLGEEKAVVSSGGLDPDDIDFRTMRSKRLANLFVVGDLIDVERRSGGFSLQLCWSTGWVAGESAAKEAE